MTTPKQESIARTFSENADVDSRYRGIRKTVAGYVLATLAIVSFPASVAAAATTTTSDCSETQTQRDVSTGRRLETSIRTESSIHGDRTQEAASFYEQSARRWEARAAELRTRPATPINGRPGMAWNRRRNVEIKSAERKARRMRSRADEVRNQARIHGGSVDISAVAED